MISYGCIKAEVGDALHGLSDVDAGEIGDADFRSVNGEAHGESGGEERDHDKTQANENAAKDLLRARVDRR